MTQIYDTKAGQPQRGIQRSRGPARRGDLTGMKNAELNQGLSPFDRTARTTERALTQTELDERQARIAERLEARRLAEVAQRTARNEYLAEIDSTLDRVAAELYAVAEKAFAEGRENKGQDVTVDWGDLYDIIQFMEGEGILNSIKQRPLVPEVSDNEVAIEGD